MTIDIAQACGLGAEPDAVKRWLSNIQQHWLLIIDKADSPATLFQLVRVGNRGSINTGRHYSQPSLYNSCKRLALHARGDRPRALSF
jgi:hypothetical protein